MIVQLAALAELCLAGMTPRVGAKGRVVIPKAIRDRVDLHPGDEVEVEVRDNEIVLVARRHPAQLGGRFARSGMAGRLLEDRAREPH
jgi:AbrB family looped-hinge helix DNA binding protein